MDAGLLPCPPVLEAEEVVYDRLYLPQALFDLAAQEEARHGHLPRRVLFQRFEHVEAVQHDGCGGHREEGSV